MRLMNRARRCNTTTSIATLTVNNLVISTISYQQNHQSQNSSLFVRPTLREVPPVKKWLTNWREGCLVVSLLTTSKVGPIQNKRINLRYQVSLSNVSQTTYHLDSNLFHQQSLRTCSHASVQDVLAKARSVRMQSVSVHCSSHNRRPPHRTRAVALRTPLK